VNFGGLSSLVRAVPATNGAQSYGLGIPTTYIQGIAIRSNRSTIFQSAFSPKIHGKLSKEIDDQLRRSLRREITPLFKRRQT